MSASLSLHNMLAVSVRHSFTHLLARKDRTLRKDRRTSTRQLSGHWLLSLLFCSVDSPELHLTYQAHQPQTLRVSTSKEHPGHREIPKCSYQKSATVSPFKMEIFRPLNTSSHPLAPPTPRPGYSIGISTNRDHVHHRGTYGATRTEQDLLIFTPEGRSYLKQM